MTSTSGFDTGDATVDDALAVIAVTDPETAGNAEAAFGSLTWGTGLQVVSLRGSQEFLWYQLPEKWAIPWPSTWPLPVPSGCCPTGAPPTVVLAYAGQPGHRSIPADHPLTVLTTPPAQEH